MTAIESDFSALVTKVSQLEKQQATLKKYVVKIKHSLDEQIENFQHRPETQSIENLQESFAALNLRLDELFALNNPIIFPPETQEISEEKSAQNTEQYQNQLVFDRSASREVLIEALETVQQRLIIVCPWLNCNGIDEYLLDKFKACLNRNCQIDIGWGYLGDRSNIGKGWKYNALADLEVLEQSYPGLFRLKLLGTHENFLVCDSEFAFVGSHNLLTSGNQSLEREVGIRTTDSEIIRGLIDRFDDGESLNEEEISQRFAASLKSLDEAEYLSGVMDMNEAEFSDNFIEEDKEEDEEDIEEEDIEESQQPVVSAEEFLRRYNEGERDFTGINLAGVDLSGKSFASSGLNLSNANLNGANLSRADLSSVNLTGAKFRDTNLCETNFTSANLSQAKFINSNLNKAKMSSVKLEKAKFRNVNLNETNLVSANFTEANLSGVNFSNSILSNSENFSSANLTKANFSGLNLKSAHFTNADLSEADLSRANLLKANLKGANLQMVKMNQALCSEVNGFPKDFDYRKLGIYFLAPNVSLQGVNLAGADLTGVNLSWADLREANLDGAKLEGSYLKHSNLSGASLKDASLLRVELITTDLTKADLRHAQLNNANLRGADLISADLRAAILYRTDLSGANLTNAKLDGALLKNTNLKGAIMPDGSIHE